MTDLVRTWLKLPGVGTVQLTEYGVSFRSAQIVGGVRQGRRGWILPVYIDPPSIYRVVDDPALIDLVIFNPAAPSRWRTVSGLGNMLGEAALREAQFGRLPLPVFRTPLAWLHSGGAGVVPLDLKSFAITVTSYPAIELVGEDIEHGRWLRGLVERAVRLDVPKVSIAA